MCFLLALSPDKRGGFSVVPATPPGKESLLQKWKYETILHRDELEVDQAMWTYEFNSIQYILFASPLCVIVSM